MLDPNADPLSDPLALMQLLADRNPGNVPFLSALASFARRNLGTATVPSIRSWLDSLPMPYNSAP